jgi:hypothetical protein
MKATEQGFIIWKMDNCFLIEKAGRTCYRSVPKSTCGMNCFEGVFVETDGTYDCSLCRFHSSYKFAQMLLAKQHSAMLEFGEAFVLLKTNRGIANEITIHRHCSFEQESTS